MVIGHTTVKLVGFTVNNNHQHGCRGIGEEENVDVRIVQEDKSDKKVE